MAIFATKYCDQNSVCRGESSWGSELSVVLGIVSWNVLPKDKKGCCILKCFHLLRKGIKSFHQRVRVADEVRTSCKELGRGTDSWQCYPSTFHVCTANRKAALPTHFWREGHSTTSHGGSFGALLQNMIWQVSMAAWSDTLYHSSHMWRVPSPWGCIKNPICLESVESTVISELIIWRELTG